MSQTPSQNPCVKRLEDFEKYEQAANKQSNKYKIADRPLVRPQRQPMVGKYYAY